MTSIAYMALPEKDLIALTHALQSGNLRKEEVVSRANFPRKGHPNFLQLPQLWRVLQAVFTGADTPDNDKLIAAIDGLEYLDAWSDIGAAYILHADVMSIAQALEKVAFTERLNAFYAHLQEQAEDIPEEQLEAFATQFSLQGTEEFEHFNTPERAQELESWFTRLRSFYRTSADEGYGVIIEFTPWA